MKHQLGLAVYAGGNHVFYIAGVLKRFLEKGLKFDVVCTYSAGGAILPYLVTNEIDEAINIFKSLTKDNKKNFYIGNLFTSSPMLPQDAIYSRAIAESYVWVEKARESSVEQRLIVSKFKAPKMLAPLVAISAVVFMGLYSITKKLTGSFFINAFKTLFRIKGEVHRLEELNDPERVGRLTLGSSTIFPFIRLRQDEGSFMLDGKVSMLTPVGELADCEHVMSIHAHYSFVPLRDNFHQIYPIEKVTVNPLDYAGYEGFVSAFDQGYREADVHYERLQSTPFFEEKTS